MPTGLWKLLGGLRGLQDRLRRRVASIVEMASCKEQSSASVADAECRCHKDSQLVHNSHGTQVVCMDHSEERKHGSREQPSRCVQKSPIKHVSDCRRPYHGNQKGALAERNQSIDREFIPKVRGRLQQTRSAFAQRQVNKLQSP